MMINDQIQNQQGGDHSTNVQGQSVVINQGLSYSDARDIAMDVYKSNFLQLSQNAAEVARNRAEELTDDFLRTLREQNAGALIEMEQPAMQAALYEAQKQYAKSGDTDLEKMLVDILVQRAQTSERNTKQIVLDEALSVISKLTQEHLNILSLNFTLVRLSKGDLLEPTALLKFLNDELLVFFNSEVEYHKSWFEHLSYTGCVTPLDVGGYHSIPQLLLGQYPALFQKGFDKSQLEEVMGKPIEGFSSFLMPCFHAVNLLQINVMNEELLNQQAIAAGVSTDDANKLKQLFKAHMMNEQEVKEWLVERIPAIEKLIELWGSQQQQFSKIKLTTVGIALAQANYKKQVESIEFDLGIWVK
ncbi:LPO_1073/Vpar_1526 family protein [Vibrio owensii]|uniref:LPO_1073/Vpar_1526 family protein n=1 Tax=Vibrio owensii TaxID=696485 RepID=UPI003CE57D18